MPTFTTLKARWATKLIRSRYFVVLTDKAAIIALDGVNPFSFEDQAALAAQSSELKLFQEQLSELVKQHDKALQTLTKDGNAKAVKKSPANYRKKQKHHQTTNGPSIRTLTEDVATPIKSKKS